MMWPSPPSTTSITHTFTANTITARTSITTADPGHYLTERAFMSQKNGTTPIVHLPTLADQLGLPPDERTQRAIHYAYSGGRRNVWE